MQPPCLRVNGCNVIMHTFKEKSRTFFLQKRNRGKTMKVVAPLCNDSELGQLPEQLTIFYNLSRLYQNLTTFRPMPGMSRKPWSYDWCMESQVSGMS